MMLKHSRQGGSTLESISFLLLWSILLGSVVYVITNVFIMNILYVHSLLLGVIIVLFVKFKFKLAKAKAKQ